MGFKKQSAKETKYDLNNAMDKVNVLAFEKEFGHKNFLECLEQRGLFRRSNLYPNGVIDGSKIEEIYDLKELYNALGRLLERRKFAERQSQDAVNALSTQTA